MDGYIVFRHHNEIPFLHSFLRHNNNKSITLLAQTSNPCFVPLPFPFPSLSLPLSVNSQLTLRTIYPSIQGLQKILLRPRHLRRPHHHHAQTPHTSTSGWGVPSYANAAQLTACANNNNNNITIATTTVIVDPPDGLRRRFYARSYVRVGRFVMADVDYSRTQPVSGGGVGSGGQQSGGGNAGGRDVQPSARRVRKRRRRMQEEEEEVPRRRDITDGRFAAVRDELGGVQRFSQGRCRWRGNCKGAHCMSDNDCAEPFSCVNNVCTIRRRRWVDLCEDLQFGCLYRIDWL